MINAEETRRQKAKNLRYKKTHSEELESGFYYTGLMGHSGRM